MTVLLIITAGCGRINNSTTHDIVGESQDNKIVEIVTSLISDEKVDDTENVSLTTTPSSTVSSLVDAQETSAFEDQSDKNSESSGSIALEKGIEISPPDDSLIYGRNPSELYNFYAEIDADFHNNQGVDFSSISIESEFSGLISDFMDVFLNTYVSKERPDLSSFYDLSTVDRKENRTIVEDYILLESIHKAYPVSTFDKTLLIKDEKQIDYNTSLISFYLKLDLYTSDGDESSGTWYFMHVQSINGENKIVKCWIQTYAFADVSN